MNLPGRATHFQHIHYRKTYYRGVCGTPSDLVTQDPNKVDCKRCRRTKVFRAALKSEDSK